MGDHALRHLHVRTDKGKLIGRVDADTFEALENWTAPKVLMDIIKDLKSKPRP
jgi:hypothetical protein